MNDLCNTRERVRVSTFEAAEVHFYCKTATWNIGGPGNKQLHSVLAVPTSYSKEREPLSDLAKITERISAIYIKSNFILTTNQSWGDK